MLDHNYVKIGHLIQTKIFWEISVPQFLSIVLYAAKLEKKIIREDHEIQCCIILFYNCAKNYPFRKKKKIGGNLTQVIVICRLSIPFHATNIEKKNI